MAVKVRLTTEKWEVYHLLTHTWNLRFYHRPIWLLPPLSQHSCENEIIAARPAGSQRFSSLTTAARRGHAAHGHCIDDTSAQPLHSIQQCRCAVFFFVQILAKSHLPFLYNPADFDFHADDAPATSSAKKRYGRRTSAAESVASEAATATTITDVEPTTAKHNRPPAHKKSKPAPARELDAKTKEKIKRDRAFLAAIDNEEL